MTITRITKVVTPASSRRLADSEKFKMGPTKADSDSDEYIDWLNDAKSAAFVQMCNREFVSETLQDEFRIRRPVYNGTMGAAGTITLSRRPVNAIAAVVDYSCFATTLSVAMTNSQTTLPCVAAFPTSVAFPFSVIIDYELMSVIGVASGTTYTVVRGAIPASHNIAAPVATLLDLTLYEVEPDTGLLTRLQACSDGSFQPISWRTGVVTVTFTAGYILPGNTGRTLPYDIEEAVVTLMRMAWKGKERDPALRSQGDGAIGNQSFFVGTPSTVTETAANYRDPKFGG